MAASGVAEHQDARRKERVYLRKAFFDKQRKAGFECGMPTTPVLPFEETKGSGEEIKARPSTPGPADGSVGKASAQQRERERAPSSYDYQLQRQQNLGRSGDHDSASVDQERRMALLAQQRQEYSAKLPNRYTSTDYISQW